jgi:hypothetical protein
MTFKSRIDFTFGLPNIKMIINYICYFVNKSHFYYK